MILLLNTKVTGEIKTKYRPLRPSLLRDSQESVRDSEASHILS